jgi:hypothetical protein
MNDMTKHQIKGINTNLYKPPPQTIMVYTTHIPATLAWLDQWTYILTITVIADPTVFGETGIILICNKTH